MTPDICKLIYERFMLHLRHLRHKYQRECCQMWKSLRTDLREENNHLEMMLIFWVMRMRFKLGKKLNSVATIKSLRLQPISSSRFSIPLCRMLAMPMVRPTLSSDLAKLEQEFVHGYREGASVFYVTTTMKTVRHKKC